MNQRWDFPRLHQAAATRAMGVSMRAAAFQLDVIETSAA